MQGSNKNLLGFGVTLPEETGRPTSLVPIHAAGSPDHAGPDGSEAESLAALFAPVHNTQPRSLGALFLTNQHRGTIETLLRAIQQGRPLVALTGPSGIGKSTLLQGALGRLREPGTRICRFDAPVSYGAVRNALAEVTTGGRTVLAIDQAELMSGRMLRYLALKARAMREAGRRLSVVLAGEPLLADLLARSVPAAPGSTPLVLALEPFTPDEAIRYIEHRVMATGYPARQIMTAKAIRIIARSSAGLPAQVNRLLDLSLKHASEQSQEWITVPVARAARADGAGAGSRSWVGPLARNMAMAAVLAGGIAFAYEALWPEPRFGQDGTVGSSAPGHHQVIAAAGRSEDAAQPGKPAVLASDGPPGAGSIPSGSAPGSGQPVMVRLPGDGAVPTSEPAVGHAPAAALATPEASSGLSPAAPAAGGATGRTQDAVGQGGGDTASPSAERTRQGDRDPETFTRQGTAGSSNRNDAASTTAEPSGRAPAGGSPSLEMSPDTAKAAKSPTAAMANVPDPSQGASRATAEGLASGRASPPASASEGQGAGSPVTSGPAATAEAFPATQPERLGSRRTSAATADATGASPVPTAQAPQPLAETRASDTVAPARAAATAEPLSSAPSTAAARSPGGTPSAVAPAPAQSASANSVPALTGATLSAAEPRTPAPAIVGTGVASALPATAPVTQAAAGNPVMRLVTAPLPDALVATLIRRGEAMRDTGDISAARLLFDRAAEAGNASAALEAGRLRDPAYLAQLRAIGVAPDPVAAAAWYRRAAALGDETASLQLQRLEEAAR